MSGKKRARNATKEKEEPVEDTGEPNSWECTLCTYRNRFEAFKCEMCDTRKGTSTRKPKLNENVVEMQKTVQKFVVQQQEKAVNSFTNVRRRTQVSGGSPSTSRLSPESNSSGSATRPSNPNSASKKGGRRMLLIPDHLIYRTSPKKITVTASGVSATLTEFRRKPGATERLGINIQKSQKQPTEEGTKSTSPSSAK